MGVAGASPVGSALTVTCRSAGTQAYSLRPSETNSFSSGVLYSHRIRPGFLTSSVPDSVVLRRSTPPS